MGFRNLLLFYHLMLIVLYRFNLNLIDNLLLYSIYDQHFLIFRYIKSPLLEFSEVYIGRLGLCIS